MSQTARARGPIRSWEVSKWRYCPHPYCHALRTTENRSWDSTVVIFTFETLHHLDNKNQWEKVSRLIAKISPTELKKRERLPRAMNPLWQRTARKWIWEAPLAGHNAGLPDGMRGAYQVSRTSQRFLRAWLQPRVGLIWQPSMVCFLAILEKYGGHSSFPYSGTDFFTTNTGRYTTSSLSLKMTGCVRFHTEPSPEGRHNDRQAMGTQVPELMSAGNPLNRHTVETFLWDAIQSIKAWSNLNIWIPVNSFFWQILIMIL